MGGYKGNIEQLSFNSSPERFFFAIVGTRRPTSYGQQITNRFSRQLSEAGMVIVSGMA
ncbi:MAG: DNA-processing protein DprA, partial [Patescibacteria group bacterium]